MFRSFEIENEFIGIQPFDEILFRLKSNEKILKLLNIERFVVVGDLLWLKNELSLMNGLIEFVDVIEIDLFALF